MIQDIIKAILSFFQGRGFLETRFMTVPIEAQTVPNGKPLNQGGCIAVYLRLNKLVLNTQTETSIAANLRQVYYGDGNGQQFELLYGETSKLIFCTDLSQVFIRGNGIANSVQVISYHLKA